MIRRNLDLEVFRRPQQEISEREPRNSQPETTSTARTTNDAEILTKINNLINDFMSGDISVKDATKTLLELGISSNVTVNNGVTTLEFEYNGKPYRVTTNSISVDDTLKDLKDSNPGLKNNGVRTLEEPILVYGGLSSLPIEPIVIGPIEVCGGLPLRPIEPPVGEVEPEPVVTPDKDSKRPINPEITTVDKTEKLPDLESPNNTFLQVLTPAEVEALGFTAEEKALYLKFVKGGEATYNIDGSFAGYTEDHYVFDRVIIDSKVFVEAQELAKYLRSKDVEDGVEEEDNTVNTNDSINNSETSSDVDLFKSAPYTKEELTDTYGFTQKDITSFFTQKDGEYLFNKVAINTNFPNVEILNINDLLEAMKNIGFTEGYIRGAYSFTGDEAEKYFIVDGEGNNKRYLLNEDLLKELYPNENIQTPGQLKDVIAGNINNIGISDAEKNSVLLEVKNAFKNGNSKWGFANLKPTQEDVDKLYNNLKADTEIKNFKGSYEDFKVLVKTKATALIGENNLQISAFSYGELRGRFGFTDLQIEMFFAKEDDSYKFNQEAINSFYGVEYQIKSVERLQEWVDTYPLGSKREDKIIDIVVEACKNEDPAWGFANLDPKPTDVEINQLSLYLNNETNSIDMSLDKFETYLKNELLPKAINHIKYLRFENMIKNDELNKNASPTETLAVVNQFAEILVAEYKNNSYYQVGSKAYMDDAIDFMIKDLGVLTKKYDLNTLLEKFESDFKNLTQYHGSAYLSDLSNYKDEDNGLSADSLFRYLENNAFSDNMEKKYFVSLFNDKFDELKLNRQEKETFIQNVIDIIEKQNAPYNTNGLNEDVYGKINLDPKLNNISLEAFYDAIQTVAKNTKHIEQLEIYEATELDISKLFDGNYTGKIDAEFIFNNLNKMLISNDAGIRKFAQMVEDAIFEYEKLPDTSTRWKMKNDIYDTTKKEKLDVIKHLIEAINYNNGVKNTDKPSLSRDLISKLNSEGIFDEIDAAINSDLFKNACIVNVDGELGEFSQGGTNDCWFLSTLISMNSNQEGKDLIKKAISWADDYSSVTVKFTKEEVTLTLEEIQEGINKRIQKGINSSGDHDALILELAYEKIGGRLDGTPTFGDWVGAIGTLSPSKLFNKSKVTTSLFTKLTGTYDDTCGGLDDLGAVITGGKTDLSGSDVKKFLRNLLAAKNAGKGYAATFGLFTSGTETFTWNCVGGGSGKCKLTQTGHVFAITDITDRWVTFVNPANSSESYTVTWDEFVNIHIGMVSASYF